jgi:hypothetical protein
VPSLAVTSLHLFWCLLALGVIFDFHFIIIPGSVLLPPLPKSILLSMTILLFFWIGILQWHTPSPFLIEEPFIDSLEVRFPNGTTKLYRPGSAIQVQADSSVTVTGVIQNGGSALCAWSKSGNLSQKTGCSAQYAPPMGLNQDTLELNVTSSCSSRNVRATFHIEVVR